MIQTCLGVIGQGESDSDLSGCDRSGRVIQICLGVIGQGESDSDLSGCDRSGRE